ncbi:MAG: WG repeat-containing protein, partial [Saprospiraceae bacterium]
MKPIFLIVNFLICYSILVAQSFPIKENGKWGLISSSGSMIVPPKYDGISEFKHENHALVQSNGKVGIIDKSGKIIIPPS